MRILVVNEDGVKWCFIRGGRDRWEFWWWTKTG